MWEIGRALGSWRLEPSQNGGNEKQEHVVMKSSFEKLCVFWGVNFLCFLVASFFLCSQALVFSFWGCQFVFLFFRTNDTNFELTIYSMLLNKYFLDSPSHNCHYQVKLFCS